MIIDWEETKERLVLAVLDRLLPLNYSFDLLCKPTTVDWRKVIDPKPETGPLNDQELLVLELHVNREGFVAKGLSVRQGTILELGEGEEKEGWGSESSELSSVSTNSKNPLAEGEGGISAGGGGKRKAGENAPGEPALKKNKKARGVGESEKPKSKFKLQPEEPLCKCDFFIAPNWNDH